jgi:branched-chain amino acid transport system permease protein
VRAAAPPTAVASPAAAAVEPAASARRWRPGPGALAVAVALLAVALLVPALFSPFWLRSFTTSAIYAIACAGIGLLYGRLGLVSLGQIALIGVGGWITLRLGHGTSLPYAVLLLLAGLGTCAVGVLVGLPALRLSGLNLAIVTLMFAGAFAIVFNATGFPDGGDGLLGRAEGSAQRLALERPTLGANDASYFRYVLVVATLLFALMALHLRSRPGRAWAAIRQSEAGALASGIDTTRSTLWALALVSFSTGVAGGLLAANAGVLDPGNFAAAESVVLFAVVLLGGAFSLLGAVLGGLLSQAFPSLLSELGVDGDLIYVVFGLGLIHAVSTAPQGIAGQLEAGARALRRRLARPEAADA